MPWSAKAQELLRSQYAAVGAAGRSALPRAAELLAQASTRLLGDAKEQTALAQENFRKRQVNIDRFVDAYRQYCWPVKSIDDLKLAPFHLLATEGKSHTHQDHQWHMKMLADICAGDSQILLATRHKILDITNPDGEQEGITW
jgi:protein phosphatase